MNDDNNKLIAEFMDIEIVDKDSDKPSNFYTQRVKQLKYDTSWDWLMPVVENIETLGNSQVNIYSNHTRISYRGLDVEKKSETKIEATYQAVIQFIKLINL